MMPVTASPRFLALDLVRGVAAVVVVLFHYSEMVGTPWLHRGWLAVDIFFCLSGFVIAHSYQQKLELGMGFMEFCRRRLSRLYPLYFLALVLGAATFFTAVDLQGRAFDSALGKSFLLGLLAIPYLNDIVIADGAGHVKGAIFPLNGPSWSLFFELFINVVFFGVLALKFKRFWLLALIGAACYAIGAKWYGLNAGWNAENFIVGFPRVFFAFFTGVFLYKVRKVEATTPVIYGLAAVVAMLVCFMLPDSKAVSLGCALLLGPAVVWVNASVSLGPRLAAIGHFLGGVSYPLYITHVPVHRAIFLMAPPSGWAAPTWVVILVSTFVAMVIAWVALRLDGQLRAYVQARRRLALGSL